MGQSLSYQMLIKGLYQPSNNLLSVHHGKGVKCTSCAMCLKKSLKRIPNPLESHLKQSFAIQTSSSQGLLKMNYLTHTVIKKDMKKLVIHLTKALKMPSNIQSLEKAIHV